jgi:hypothetical protein
MMGRYLWMKAESKPEVESSGQGLRIETLSRAFSHPRGKVVGRQAA